jgi:hypothetical protein
VPGSRLCVPSPWAYHARARGSIDDIKSDSGYDKNSKTWVWKCSGFRYSTEVNFIEQFGLTWVNIHYIEFCMGWIF